MFLLGRSNVGKSTLINALSGKKNLAPVSKTPGKTKTLKHYPLERDGLRLLCVDLPGYGYARVSKTLQQQWAKELPRWLPKSSTAPLPDEVDVSMTPASVLFWLVDARHGPLPTDEGALAYFEAQGLKAFPLVAVLTKTDKTTQKNVALQIQRLEQLCQDGYNWPLSGVFPVSALHQKGVEALWRHIRAVCPAPPPQLAE
jgi:GTP-binding protein